MIEYTVQVFPNNSKFWYHNSICHREDGPAIESANGDNIWFKHGKMHREDGPAIEYANGSNAWYLNGECLTESEFNSKMFPIKEMTIAEIEALLGMSIKIIK